jgi:hydroxymethylbilane synthase
MRLKISARKSDLARLQAYMVGDALKKQNPDLEVEYKFKESLGDINLTDPLWKIPQKGVFTEDFYGELVRGETDLVVHSWKDLPTELKNDTEIIATLPRADQRDLLLVKKSHLEKMTASKSIRVFSSSPRREYNLTGFLKSHLPFPIENVKFENVRGNIPTRIRKLLEASETDGLILAKAALDRLLTSPQAEFSEVQTLLQGQLKDLNWMVLPLSINPNAAAQGALAVEIISSRKDLKSLFSKINHSDTFQCALKEREILARFGGGCHQKIGVTVLARPYGEITILKGLTNAGVVLDSRTLKTQTEAPKFKSEKMWSSEVHADRIPIKNWSIPQNVNALYVARSEAWPADFNFPHFVWSAGIKTWKNLAQKGIWVHGCSEGLGEREQVGMEALVGIDIKALKWAKMTHDRANDHQDKSGKTEAMTVIPTYSLKLNGNFDSCLDKESFFWSSGTQFLAAIEKVPEILNKFHGCGPGNTFDFIRSYLEEKNEFDPSRLRIFLDQEDWRQQCTQIQTP